MSEAPPPYSPSGDDPFVNQSVASPNYSSIAPPCPENLARPAGSRPNAGFWVLRIAQIAGIVETWIQAATAISGVTGPSMIAAKGWDEAVGIYTAAFRAGSVHIVHVPTSNALPRTPGCSGSQPLIVDSNAPSPVRPITVHSSPATIPSTAQSTAVTPVRQGTRSHPVMIGSSPATAPSAAVQPSAMTPATQGIRDYTVVVGNPPALASTYSNAPASNRSSQTPTPLTPRRANTPAASAERLRIIEDALEQYADRNGHAVPLPKTPTSDDITPDGLEARLNIVEECMNDLLTRKAEHASVVNELRQQHAITAATLAFERCRNRMITEGRISVNRPAYQQDGRDPTPTDSRDLMPVDGSDPTLPHTPFAGLSAGPGTTAHSIAPIAGLSTGPGTASHPIQPSSSDRDLFEGFKDYTPEEAAVLEALLDAQGY